MPLSATIEDIKTYQTKVEKNKIKPKDLAPCPRCCFESKYFKIHSYRERRFLIIVELLVQVVLCVLVRFKCTNCGKTFTFYPDFAIPHKHYTRQTVKSFSSSYVEYDQKTYREAVAIDAAVPERQGSGQQLSPSTIHRWISTLADLFQAVKKKALKKLSQRFYSHLIRVTIPAKKYKTNKRRACLFRCRLFLKAGFFVEKISFTEFGTGSGLP